MDLVCPHPHPGTQTPVKTESPGELSPSDLWVQNGLALRLHQQLWMQSLAFGDLPLGGAATWPKALRGTLPDVEGVGSLDCLFTELYKCM